MLNFLHAYSPQPILLSLGPVQIHWYGFLMVIGGLLGLWLAVRLAARYQLDKKIFDDLFLYWVIGAVIGARVYYVLYAWEMYQENWLDIFKIWQGGLAIHGIMLGGFSATIIYCRIKKIDFWLLADVLAVGLVAAQIIGRLGNYFNQEIVGLPTNLPWGILIDAGNRPFGYGNSLYFHPTFLYESLGNLIILGILLLVTFQRFKRKKRQAGNIFLIYLILYSVLRFGLEFLRTDYSPYVFGVRWAMIVSGAIIIVCAAFLIKRNWFEIKIPESKIKSQK